MFFTIVFEIDMLNCITKFTLPYFKRVDIILKKCKNKNIILKESRIHFIVISCHKNKGQVHLQIFTLLQKKKQISNTPTQIDMIKNNDYLPFGYFGTVTDNASITDRAIFGEEIAEIVFCSLKWKI